MFFSWLLKKSGLSQKMGKSLPLVVGLLAAVAFLALAVFGWGVPAETILKFLGVSLVLLMGVLVAAFLVVFIVKNVLKLLARK